MRGRAGWNSARDMNNELKVFDDSLVHPRLAMMTDMADYYVFICYCVVPIESETEPEAIRYRHVFV